MIPLLIENDIKLKLTHLSLGLISGNVVNTGSNPKLWIKIDEETEKIKKSHSLNNVKDQPNIYLTREAYRLLAKDPNRYRPSAEALYRRILKGAPLYKISTVVDIINLVSLKTGFSINGFDADKIKGRAMLGIGSQNEPFEAIGRGELNIENLPVYRDEIGPIGTPTSDHVRTSITLDTKSVLLIINNYGMENNELAESMKEVISLLKSYAQSEIYESIIV
jgi:DNA/RNA-binding domain of Phe-tRNA-synthetase-like protein